MKAKTRQKTIYLISALAVTWAVYDFSRSHGKKPSNSVSEAVAARQESTIKRAMPEANTIDSLSSAPWGADPFRAKSSKRKTSEPKSAAGLSWTVSGILYNSNNPVAYVNGRMARIGDIVNQARITAIDRKTVTLDHHGTQVVISVGKG